MQSQILEVYFSTMPSLVIMAFRPEIFEGWLFWWNQLIFLQNPFKNPPKLNQMHLIWNQNFEIFEKFKKITVTP